MSEQPAFIYIISTVRDGEPCAPVKIGVSNNPASRLASLQTACPYDIELTYAFSAHTERDMAGIIETVSHQVGDKVRLRGEWFDVHPFDAIRLVAGVIQGVWLEVCPEHLMPRDQAEFWRVSGIQAAFDFCASQWPARMPCGALQ